MSDLKLTKTRFEAGTWEGMISGRDGMSDVPELEVRHLDQVVEGHRVSVAPDQPDHWCFQFDIPARLISEGVQTFVISKRDTGEKLDSFSIVAGEAVADNLRAEVNLLRAELDMLKGAFRRHCVETSS